MIGSLRKESGKGSQLLARRVDLERRNRNSPNPNYSQRPSDLPIKLLLHHQRTIRQLQVPHSRVGSSLVVIESSDELDVELLRGLDPDVSRVRVERTVEELGDFTEKPDLARTIVRGDELREGEEQEGRSARVELVEERRVEREREKTNRLFQAFILDGVSDVGVVLLSNILCESRERRGEGKGQRVEFEKKKRKLDASATCLSRLVPAVDLLPPL